MKVFVSWSGVQSKRIALALKDWLPSVLQFADIFMSETDIASGDRGLARIATNLNEARFGIVVLTKSNFTAPWVLFEAGALSIFHGKVAPLLCNMDPLSLLDSPLQQFQHNKFEKEGLRKLVKAMNALSESPNDDARLQKTFEVWWPSLEEEYRRISTDYADGSPGAPPTEDKIASALAQIFDELGQQRRVQNVMQGMVFATLKELGAATPATVSDGSTVELRPPAWAEGLAPPVRARSGPSTKWLKIGHAVG
ncbi:TIR domain-containing protein [Mesorhizobium sp.]|uniref:TIR domain-containing protein n=1 Tax=Mesorhizobium sp. TaxID=1871066 RepID=UPI00257D358E|nr:TIR domain-containing protein [Mesorhizobium sp.]